eukprot:scpid39355/ scgid33055/ 
MMAGARFFDPSPSAVAMIAGSAEHCYIGGDVCLELLISSDRTNLRTEVVSGPKQRFINAPHIRTSASHSQLAPSLHAVSSRCVEYNVHYVPRLFLHKKCCRQAITIPWHSSTGMGWCMVCRPRARSQRTKKKTRGNFFSLAC